MADRRHLNHGNVSGRFFGGSPTVLYIFVVRGIPPSRFEFSTLISLSVVWSLCLRSRDEFSTVMNLSVVGLQSPTVVL